MSSISIQWNHRGAIRRFGFPIPINGDIYGALMAKIIAVQPDFNESLAWKDTEDDMIVFTSKTELTEAINLLENNEFLRIFTIGEKEDFNFGFAGPVNCGKSSLVNAVRGVKKTDQGYAKVDVVEVTNPITKHKFKEDRFKNLILWDIPGYGSPRLNMETFSKENFLYTFDSLFLMLGETNLSNNDVMFARQAKVAKKKIALIKSKCDILVLDHWGDPDAEPKFSSMLETATYIYATVKDSHLRYCPEDLRDVPYFLISSRSIALACDNKVAFDDKQSWRMVFDETELSIFMAKCARKRVPYVEDVLFKMCPWLDREDC